MKISKKLIIVLLALAFSIITFFVLFSETLHVDTVIREGLYSLRNPVFTAIFKGITFWGNKETVAVICLILLFFSSKKMQIALPLIVSAVISVMLQTAMKIGFGRERPDLALRLVEAGGFSFPSGHSMTVLVFYGATLLVCRQHLTNKIAVKVLSVLLPLLIFLIGISRIYLGVHFPTDVLAGWAMGGFLLLILSATPLFAQKNIPSSH